MLSASAHQPELCAAVTSLTFTCRLQGVGTLFGKSAGPSVEGSVMTGPLEINVSWGRFSSTDNHPPSSPLSQTTPEKSCVAFCFVFLQQNSADVAVSLFICRAVCVTVSLAASLVVSAPTGDTNDTMMV